MILSFEKNFLFVKTRKTASTSIEIALSPICADEDVITPISPEDEVIRESRFGVLPRNFSSSARLEKKYRKSIEAGDPSGINSSRIRTLRKGVYWNHMSAGEIRRTLRLNIWDQLFKFTIERHPYEKAISLAYFLFSDVEEADVTLEDFLDSTIEKGLYKNIDLYSNEEGLLVDKVFKYEELPSCLCAVESRLGVEFVKNLPVTKNQSRMDRRPAIDVLTSSQKNIIRDHCFSEFELLGYET